MDNNSKILPRKKTNIYENLKKINTLDSTSSSLHHKKLKLKNEFTTFKFSEKTNSKKIVDFPLCLSLFTNNQTKNDIEQKIKDNNKSKLNLNIKSLKPQNLKSLNFNDIIGPNNKKKIISRNPNYFNSISPINSKKIISSRFSTPMKHNSSLLKKINYSPSNLNAKQKPIAIDQIGLRKPILKLNTKLNSRSNSSIIEQDICLLGNMKGLSVNSFNYKINFNDKRIIPSLFSSPSISESLKKEKNEKIKNKKKINKMKKRVHNDIKNFEYRINNISQKMKENEKVNINDNNYYNKDNSNDDNKKKIFNKKNNSHKNISNLYDKNQNEKILENTIKDNKSNTIYKESNNSLYNLKEYFNINLYNRFFNKHFTDKTANNKENDKLSYNELNTNNKLENKKENNILEKKNDNISKMERLSRLKSSFKTGAKAKNKIVINEANENNINKKGDIKGKNKSVSINRKETAYLFDIINKNKPSLFQEEKKTIGVMKRSQSTKNIDTTKINIIKLKNNKFYLSICKKKINNIYNNNKFLKKWNNKLNGIKSNNRMNRRIYVNKTKMLLNIQEKINTFINNEKSNLKMHKDIDIDKNNIYFNEIFKDKNNYKNDEEKIINQLELINIFNCNLSISIYNYINSSIEFDGLSDIIFFKNNKKQPLIKKNKQKITRRKFQTVKIKNISIFDLENSEDKFLITKTKDTFRNDDDWIYSPINLLSIQELVLRSNQYYYDFNFHKLKKKHNFTIKRSLSKKFSDKMEKILEKQNILGKKFNLNISNLKKHIFKKNPYDFSLLNQKKFFKRPKIVKKLKLEGKIKEKQEISALSEFSSDEISSNYLDNSKDDNLEDIYFNLVTYIIEAKNKQFIKLFDENKNVININQQLIEGNTLLILSAREGNHLISKYLCDQGIDVNIQNNTGNTALHYAIGNQFYSIADVLTRFGAREDIPNTKGLLPWDCIENNLE